MIGFPGMLCGNSYNVSSEEWQGLNSVAFNNVHTNDYFALSCSSLAAQQLTTPSRLKAKPRRPRNVVNRRRQRNIAKETQGTKVQKVG